MPSPVTVINEAAPPSEDAQLASFLTRVEVKLDTVLTRGDDHETRIRSLERKVWTAAGAAAVAGAGLGQIVSVLTAP
ncbi:hypothetical protein MTE01_28960 [Microbacterium testaceum]|uniref:Uncharacterized protein n=1 Tax=Microbacterium testaceum TaxID=2033 RepID=A0A4Y3QP88_MICTE|nr:hypothetical protein [Microbacterium testaceum]GEB46951.1 hypothetical protein MTE01_28960 [Microbacterium testaceum]